MIRRYLTTAGPRGPVPGWSDLSLSPTPTEPPIQERGPAVSDDHRPTAPNVEPAATDDTPYAVVEDNSVRAAWDAWLAHRATTALPALTERIHALYAALRDQFQVLDCAAADLAMVVPGFIAARTGELDSETVVSTINDSHCLSTGFTAWLYDDPDHGPVALVGTHDDYRDPETITAYLDGTDDEGRWFDYGRGAYSWLCGSCGWSCRAVDLPDELDLFTDADVGPVEGCPACCEHHAWQTSDGVDHCEQGCTACGNHGYAAHCPRCRAHLTAGE